MNWLGATDGDREMLTMLARAMGASDAEISDMIRQLDAGQGNVSLILTRYKAAKEPPKHPALDPLPPLYPSLDPLPPSDNTWLWLAGIAGVGFLLWREKLL